MTKYSLLLGSALALLAVPAAAQTADDAQPQDDVVVEGRYTIPDKIDTATGLGLTVRETPQSVSIITAQRILDQNLISIADVIQNGVGVTVNEVDDVRNNFYARGFEIRNTQLDGVPTNWTLAGGAGETNIDVSIFERVEIVRGATGLLSGAGDPSASVNLVRKHADATDWGGYANASYGSWDTVRLSGDVGGAITADGRVRVRAVGRYEQGNSYIDLYKNKKFVLYGVIDADVTDNTLLRVGMSHQEAQPDGATWGALPTFYSDGSLTNWPRSKTPAAPWTHWNTTNQNIFATIRHDFNDRWSIVANYNRVRNAQQTELLYLSGTVDRATGQIQYAFPYKDEGNNVQNSFDGQIKGLVKLFGRDHEIVLGALTSSQDRDTSTFAALSFPPGTNFEQSGGTTYPYPGFSTTASVGEKTKIKQEGYYGAVRLNVSDSLKIIGGGRLASWNINGVQFGVTTDYGNKNEFIPYVGALYDITPNHRLYGSFTKIFQPQNARDRNLDLLAPLDGKAYEIGLKSAFFNEALQTSVALFRIEQDNVAQNDIVITPPNGLPQQTYRAAQGVTSQGFELEVTGRPLPGWNVNFGYSQFKAEDRDDVAANTDQPRRLLKLFTTYTLPGALDRVTVGGGVNYRSKAYTASTNPVLSTLTNPVPFNFEQKGYALVSLMTRVALTERLQLQANLENLFDKTFYSQVGFFDQYRYGAPRNFTISANYRF
ncbi:TonB-dependent siderophore receptor [Sphingomonas hylomeconis]|uniref:TonB-dependent siderophore receptor n=1 Tax=Sphingomonas hylomeconis TaxID=1395958 RepID=A0ABV7SW12_9SPHN|nr:TonB-dependent siderophore receptor [Sphingomonas hylomeconis]